MKRMILAALAALAVPACAGTPAAAQTIAGCGTVAITKADQNNAAKLGIAADCFAKAKATATGAEDARRARIAAIAPKPTPAPAPTPAPTPDVVPAMKADGWQRCSDEWKTCSLTGEAYVRFGGANRYAVRLVSTASIVCSNVMYGDPAPGTSKECDYQLTGRPTTSAAAASPPPAPVPVTYFADGKAVTDTPRETLIAAGERAWPVPAKPTTRRGLLGVNVAGTPWWGGDQTYANLLMGNGWRGGTGGEWGEIPHAELDPVSGYPDAARIGKAYPALIVLTPPFTTYKRDATVRCTWQGTGDILIAGSVNADLKRDLSARTMSFTWKQNTDNGNSNWLHIYRSDPADPIRNIDCRADGVEAVGIFTKQVVDYYRQFGVLRFLDASGVNGNGKWTWANRTQPGDITQGGADGMALENQIALAKVTGADPWLNVSWNADDTYKRGAAQLVRKLLAGTSLRAYVENSNEVWNYAFGVASQARDESLALKLTPDNDGFKGAMLLYAKRSADLFRIWTEEFKDAPGQLIRVAAGQSDNPWVTGIILGESGLARSGLVDAFAIAPYFAGSVLNDNRGVNDNDRLFPLITAHKETVLTQQVPSQLAVVKSFGLRLIDYEAGQHLVDGDDASRVASLNRDPRMGAEYADYIPRAVAANDNDLVVLFNATGRTSKWGAWGIREYAGQPIAETPKLKAVQDYLAGK